LTDSTSRGPAEMRIARLMANQGNVAMEILKLFWQEQ
jgi:hypothetical protein